MATLIEVIKKAAEDYRFQKLGAPEALKWLEQCQIAIAKKLGLTDFERINPNGNGSAVILKSGDKVVRISLGEPPHRVWHEHIVQPLHSNHNNGLRFEVMDYVENNASDASKIATAKGQTTLELSEAGLYIKNDDKLRDSNWLVTADKNGNVSAKMLDGDAVEIKDWQKYGNYLWNKGITTYVVEAWLKQPPISTLLEATGNLATALTFGYAKF